MFLYLQTESFRPCHSAVSLDPYFASCVYDLCACVNQSACLCDILSSYSKECAKAGVRLQWRSDSLCGKTDIFYLFLNIVGSVSFNLIKKFNVCVTKVIINSHY